MLLIQYYRYSVKKYNNHLKPHKGSYSFYIVIFELKYYIILNKNYSYYNNKRRISKLFENSLMMMMKCY